MSELIGEPRLVICDTAYVCPLGRIHRYPESGRRPVEFTFGIDAVAPHETDCLFGDQETRDRIDRSPRYLLEPVSKTR